MIQNIPIYTLLIILNNLALHTITVNANILPSGWKGTEDGDTTSQSTTELTTSFPTGNSSQFIATSSSLYEPEPSSNASTVLVGESTPKKPEPWYHLYFSQFVWTQSNKIQNGYEYSGFGPGFWAFSFNETYTEETFDLIAYEPTAKSQGGEKTAVGKATASMHCTAKATKSASSIETVDIIWYDLPTSTQVGEATLTCSHIGSTPTPPPAESSISESNIVQKMTATIIK
ncbi:uncharacterized protein L201_001498 [Kwoniella dendrophila CBS 6074]|uniref:Ig-like domain-containing protein n=1 Tax=Kwoniella dendrophila CBS 6074 TaxID=1295534 RepID=A0AAX4JMG9_9TREE